MLNCFCSGRLIQGSALWVMLSVIQCTLRQTPQQSRQQGRMPCMWLVQAESYMTFRARSWKWPWSIPTILMLAIHMYLRFILQSNPNNRRGLRGGNVVLVLETYQLQMDAQMGIAYRG